MQRRDDNDSDLPQPPGICRRLFSFVVAKLVASHLRRMTLGKTELRQSNEVKEDGSSRNKLKKMESRSDITIHFKQTEDSEENGNPTNKHGSSGHEAEREKHIPAVKENGLPDTKRHKKTVSIMEKGKSTVSDEPSSGQPLAQPENPKPHKHLLSVASNINEKSAAFIRDKKEKMRKNYSLETKT